MRFLTDTCLMLVTYALIFLYSFILGNSPKDAGIPWLIGVTAFSLIACIYITRFGVFLKIFMYLTSGVSFLAITYFYYSIKNDFLMPHNVNMDVTVGLFIYITFLMALALGIFQEKFFILIRYFITNANSDTYIELARKINDNELNDETLRVSKEFDYNNAIIALVIIILAIDITCNVINIKTNIVPSDTLHNTLLILTRTSYYGIGTGMILLLTLFDRIDKQREILVLLEKLTPSGKRYIERIYK